MELDLKRNADKVRAMVERRIKSLSKAAEKRQIPSASYINLGYQYEESGWGSLFIDQRENAEPDGEWTRHIGRYKIDMPHWVEAYEVLDNEELTLHLPDGCSMTVRPGIAEED